MIILDHVNKCYGTGECKQEILKNISLHVESGEMVSVMGPSGSGKSTMLNILGLLDGEFNGEYRVDQISTVNMTEKEYASLRNKKIGFVFQSFHLLKDLTALENVQMGLIISNIHRSSREKVKKNKIKEQSIEMLKAMGLQDHMNKKASQLSGGQQQRVAIARALVNDPEIILADEPTGALDQKNGKEIMDIFVKLNKLGKTIIIVTHDKNVASCCTRNISIVDGVITE